MLLRSKGQGLAEYALILALIAILAITALLFLSGQIDTILSTHRPRSVAAALRQTKGRASGAALFHALRTPPATLETPRSAAQLRRNLPSLPSPLV